MMFVDLKSVFRGIVYYNGFGPFAQYFSCLRCLICATCSGFSDILVFKSLPMVCEFPAQHRFVTCSGQFFEQLHNFLATEKMASMDSVSDIEYVMVRPFFSENMTPASLSVFRW